MNDIRKESLVKIACIQMQPAIGEKDFNIHKSAELIESAAGEGATLIPIDSETNAMFQCLPAYRCGEPAAERGVRRLLLTASGGPFLRVSAAQMANATPQQACAHPRWQK